MKNYFLFYFILISTVCSAQISPDDFQKIKSYEDTIRIYGDTLINSETKENRTIASYRIIKTLTKALKLKTHFIIIGILCCQ
ncbi:MAG: hypothetical protein IPF58_01675 [Saprospirales bacterium]|nr:hypothetical protein [Saprospirales bacterium]